MRCQCACSRPPPTITKRRKNPRDHAGTTADERRGTDATLKRKKAMSNTDAIHPRYGDELAGLEQSIP
jgi:hypothetical protein